jgi:hypothetical protein
MYACILETGRGFFEGACALGNATAYFRDPLPYRFANRAPPAPVAARASGAK